MTRIALSLLSALAAAPVYADAIERMLNSPTFSTRIGTGGLTNKGERFDYLNDAIKEDRWRYAIGEDALYGQDLPPVEQLSPRDRVREIQQRLSNMGFSPGPVDGVIGDRTRAAVARFSHVHNLEQPVEIGAAFLKLLRNHGEKDENKATP